ncbi:MAG: PAS domain S-box protein, partial [Myxococcales bacterium]|nr:PAS domain S-box protein [Myxococcales bacterium]
MNVQLAPGAERWATWLADEGHHATMLSAADRAEPGHLVLVAGDDVAACNVAAARGALVIAADVTDELAMPLARAGARYLWRAGATPAWLRAELALLANTVADPIHASSCEHYESTIRLHALLSHSATIIASINRDGVFTFVAGEALARLGFNPEMLLGHNALELFSSLTMVLDGQTISVGELFARVFLGESLFVSTEVGGRKLDVRYGPLRREGRIDGVMAVVHDVTERHAVEARARDAEEQLRTVVHSSPLLLLVFDTDGIITFADGSSLRAVTAPSRIVGVSIDALYSMWQQPPEVTTADGKTPPRGSVVAAALAGQSSAGDVRFHGRRFDYKTVPLYRDGQVIGGICVAFDRTEHDRAEEAVRVADESLRAFMDASPEPIGILRDGKLVAANGALTQTLGYEPGELVGRDALELVAADERAQSASVLERMRGGESFRGVDRRMRRKDGTVATLHYSAVNIVFDGAPSVVLIGSDVSEQRRMQHKLMLAERMASM